MSKRKQIHLDYDQRDLAALRGANITATMQEDESLRFDSAEEASVFFARELDYVKAKTYDRLYPELTALRLFPQTSEADPGGESITYYGYEKTGLAKIISNYATDLPRVDVAGEPHTAYIKSLGASYGYSVKELRSSRMAGKNLDARKADAARYQIEALNNRIAWAGDPSHKLMGVLSIGNDIPLYVLPNGASGKTEWASKTAQEILSDIKGFQAQVSAATKNVEKPDTLALPSDVYIDICNRQLEHTSVSIKTYILNNAPYLKDIVDAAELNSNSTDTNPYAAAVGGKGVAFFYTNDPEKLSIETPMPFYQYPVQPKGLEIEVPCEACTAGALIYYPLSALIAVGI